MKRKELVKYNNSLIESATLTKSSLNKSRIESILKNNSFLIKESKYEVNENAVMAGWRGAQLRGFGTEGTEVSGTWFEEMGVSLGAMARTIADMFRKGVKIPDPTLIDPNKGAVELVRDILKSQKIWQQLFKVLFRKIDPQLPVANTIRELNRNVSVTHSYLIRIVKGITQNILLALGGSGSGEIAAQLYSNMPPAPKGGGNAMFNESLLERRRPSNQKDEYDIESLQNLLSVHEKLSELIATYQEQMPRNMKDFKHLSIALDQFYSILTEEWLDQDISAKIETLAVEMEKSYKNQQRNVKELTNQLKKYKIESAELITQFLQFLSDGNKQGKDQNIINFVSNFPFFTNETAKNMLTDYLIAISANKNWPGNIRKLAENLLNNGIKIYNDKEEQEKKELEETYANQLDFIEDEDTKEFLTQALVNLFKRTGVQLTPEEIKAAIQKYIDPQGSNPQGDPKAQGN